MTDSPFDRRIARLAMIMFGFAIVALAAGMLGA
jgi:hypothetical protein